MDKKIRKIDALLEYGEIFSFTLMFFVYFMFILGVGGIILTLCIAVIEKEYIVLSILPFFLLGIVSSVFIFLMHRKQISRAKKFLFDAVELSAKTKMLDSSYAQNGFFRVPITKIAVEFNYDGTNIVRHSGLKEYKGGLRNNKGGYNKVFNKYANRQIQILYSPKYDQVLILKDKKQKNKK